jgi:hypothetical protein
MPQVWSMFRFAAIALVAVVCSACSSSSSKSAAPVGPPGTTAPGSNAGTTTYGAGFYPEERGPAGSFRWMGAAGIIRLPNTHRDMILSFTAFLPNEVSQNSLLALELNGASLGSPRPLAKGSTTIQQEVSASQQGSADMSELRLGVSMPFVPAQTFPNSSDRRELGLALSNLSWQPK